MRDPQNLRTHFEVDKVSTTNLLLHESRHILLSDVRRWQYAWFLTDWIRATAPPGKPHSVFITAECSSQNLSSLVVSHFESEQSSRNIVVKLYCQVSKKWERRIEKQRQSVLIHFSTLDKRIFFCLFRFLLVPPGPKCSAPNQFIWSWALKYEISLDSFWPKFLLIKDKNNFHFQGQIFPSTLLFTF